jgi:hypothetical protein
MKSSPNAHRIIRLAQFPKLTASIVLIMIESELSVEIVVTIGCSRYQINELSCGRVIGFCYKKRLVWHHEPELLFCKQTKSAAGTEFYFSKGPCQA